ncbi:hypothetical protein JOC36_000063 [Weissella uvarum]|nr:hypothetical protein [Weissella uvarum]MBM7616530.1 hypothetical protein [Weissella uvarum]MCM0595009.1 hypothetical protein [Weissella uvarum]
MGVYISSSSKSSNSHVSSESSSKKLSSEKTSTSEETSSSEVASSQEATQPTDDGYNYILVFADGTTRLSRTAPTSEYWQEGTSSAASNGHPGRTTYNQLSFKQMGGETGTGTSEDDRDEYMKDWNEDYDNDSQAMMEKSIPYHG